MPTNQLHSPYRYRHKATGLYYCPNRKHVLVIKDSTGSNKFHVNTNLSKVGKIYLHTPAETPGQGPSKGAFMNHCDALRTLVHAARSGYLDHYKVGGDRRKKESKSFEYLPDEWEVETVNAAVESQKLERTLVRK